MAQVVLQVALQAVHLEEAQVVLQQVEVLQEMVGVVALVDLLLEVQEALEVQEDLEAFQVGLEVWLLVVRVAYLVDLVV